MYQLYITIPASAHKQLFTLGLACFRCLHLALRLFLYFLQMFGSEAGTHIDPIGVFSMRKIDLLVLWVMPWVELPILWTIAAVNDLFYLMFYLLFGYRSMGMWGILCLWFLLIVKWLQQCFVWWFWLLFYWRLSIIHHSNR